MHPLKGTELVTADEIRTMFSNVEVLFNFSNKLLTELEQRMETWSNTQLVGDIFLKFVSRSNGHIKTDRNAKVRDHTGQP